jgi:hypothetical protein
VKWPVGEVDLSPPSSWKVKMRGAILPLPNTTSWRCAQLSRGTTLHFPSMPKSS